MTNKSLLNFGMFFILFATIYFTACKKNTVVDPPVVATCATKTIVITATTTASASPTATNGSITASATGSTGFTFSKDGTTFQASGIFSNLAAGNYTITAKDDAGCTGSKAFVVTATSCPTITVTGTTTAASSAGSSNGAINASATGSTGLTYSKDGTLFQATGTFTGLAVGSYTITAKDLNGCLGIAAFTISVASCPTITVTGTSTPAAGPTATNGTITASASGGATPYEYSRNGTTFQATGAFTGLAVGSYTITAKDANGCLGSVVINVANNCPTITVTGTSTPAAGPTATNGTITASASGGATPYEYSRNGTTFQTTGAFTGLAIGSYTITAKDANGCLSSVIINVANSCPTITLTATPTGADKCLNPTTSGAISVSAIGSTGLMYNINSGTFQTGTLFGSLTPGTYTMGVRDLNGCTTTTPATVAVAPAGPNFTAVKAVLVANCAIPGCHAGATPQSGINFTDDCTIVSRSARIKARAVDANPSVMPPTGAISNADKQKITDWINAGGGHRN
jgi:large repetitive protein